MNGNKTARTHNHNTIHSTHRHRHTRDRHTQVQIHGVLSAHVPQRPLSWRQARPESPKNHRRQANLFSFLATVPPTVCSQPYGVQIIVICAVKRSLIHTSYGFSLSILLCILNSSSIKVWGDDVRGYEPSHHQLSWKSACVTHLNTEGDWLTDWLTDWAGLTTRLNVCLFADLLASLWLFTEGRNTSPVTATHHSFCACVYKTGKQDKGSIRHSSKKKKH